MTIQEARKEIIESGVNLGAGDYIDIEALKVAVNALGAIEQIIWERDVAIEQLNELGLSLGQKVDDVKVINLNELTKNVEEKMTYMCGCRNCIETITQVIKGERKPLESHCSQCGKFEECKEKR